MPTEIEDWWVPFESYKLPRLLAEMPFLASSVAEARRLIAQDAVRVDGERISDANYTIDLREPGRAVILQVGKKRFVRVRGGDADASSGLRQVKSN